MAPSNWDWVFIALGWTLAGIGLLLVLWALLWDRSRGRRRCPKCWYSMEGAVEGDDGSLTCPECGRSPRSPRSLHRTRRRKKLACFAIAIMAVAWPIGSYPEIGRGGWPGLLPTRVVIELLPLGGMEGPLGKDLERRLGFAPDRHGNTEVSISHSEQVYLVRRVTKGNWLARPIGERWRASYGELHARDLGRLFTFGSYTRSTQYLDGTLADGALNDAMTAMLDTPVDLRLRTRRGWPAGMPVIIEVGVDRWWPRGASGTMRMKWQTPDGSQSGESQPFSRNISVPPIHPTESMPQPTVEIEITQRPSIWQRSRTDFIEGETTKHTLSWVIVDSIDDVMTPVRSPELDAHLEQVLKPSWEEQQWGGHVRLHAEDLSATIVQAISFGMQGDLWHDGESVGTINFSWVGNMQPVVLGGSGSGMTMRTSIDPTYLAAHRGEGGWIIKLRTDHRSALLNIESNTYWDGEITLPLTIR